MLCALARGSEVLDTRRERATANVAEWLLDRARAGGGGKKDQRDDGNGTDVSPSHLGLCPRPGGSPSEQDRGLLTTRYLVSVCVVRRPSLSGDGIPASPSSRVTALAPASSPIWTWSCTDRYVVLLLLLCQVSGGGGGAGRNQACCCAKPP